MYRHHLFYFDADSVVRGKAADTPYVGSWDDNDGFNGKNYGGDGLSLATYSKECETCYAANAVVFFDGSLQYTTPQTKDGDRLSWNQNPFPAKLPKPANGSQLEIKPLYTGASGKRQFIVMFLAIRGQKLAKLLYNAAEDDWESGRTSALVVLLLRLTAFAETLNTTLEARSSIAAFTTGTFVSGSDSASNYTMQVLNTHPSQSGGGVSLSSYSSSTATWNFTLLESGFEKILNESGLAANQAGRVYGTVRSDEGSLQLMEWAWDMENGTYTMTGPVNTNAVT